MKTKRISEHQRFGFFISNHEQVFLLGIVIIFWTSINPLTTNLPHYIKTYFPANFRGLICWNWRNIRNKVWRWSLRKVILINFERVLFCFFWCVSEISFRNVKLRFHGIFCEMCFCFFAKIIFMICFQEPSKLFMAEIQVRLSEYDFTRIFCKI